MSISPASTLRRFPFGKGKTLVAGFAVAALIGAGISLTAASSAQADTAGEVTGQVYLGSSESSSIPDDNTLVVAALEFNAESGTTTEVGGAPVVSGAWSYSNLDQGDYVFEARASDPNSTLAPEFFGLDGNAWPTLNDALSAQIASGSVFYTLGSAPTSADNAYVASGVTIHGSVTDGDSNALAGQTVTLYYSETNGTTTAQSQQQFATTTTGTGGTYSFSGLPTGDFTLSAGGSNGYSLQFYDDKYVENADDATTFTDSTPGDSKQIDFALDPSASVSGTVTSSSKKDLAGIDVTIYRSAADAVAGRPGFATTTTAKNGTYTFASLPPGSAYVVEFASGPSSSTQYVSQWYNLEDTAADADPFELDAGEVLGGINAVLSNSGSITGTITTSGGTALSPSDYTVEACEVQDLLGTSNEAACEYGSAPVRADSNGNYRLNVEPGEYTVAVVVSGSNYQSQYYDNNYTGIDVGTVFVTTGKITPHINMTLVPGASISGTVTDGSSHPIEGDQVTAVINFGATAVDGHDPDSPLTHTATTDANGNYTIEGLSDGNYGVELLPTDGGADGWYPASTTEASAQTFAITDSSSAYTGVDFQELGTGTILGHVSSSEFPAGEGDVDVEVSQFRSSTSETADYVGDYTTDDAGGTIGNYTIAGLTPGDYLVQFIPDNNADELENYYGVNPDLGPSHATRITVTAGNSNEADDTLDQGGSYTGYVKDSSGVGIPDVAVLTGDGNSSAVTDGTGKFTLTGALTGAHTLAFYPDNEDNDTNFSDAEYLAPAVDFSYDGTPAVDVGTITLTENTTISGLVLGTNGKPVNDVAVAAVPTYTYAAGKIPDGSEDSVFDRVGQTGKDGKFLIGGLSPGLYYLEFLPDNGSPYPTQFLGGSAIAGTSETVDVSAEGAAVYRVAHLVGGGSVTGTITSAATGKPIRDMEVDVYQSPTSTDGDATLSLGDGAGFLGYYSATTNSKGRYTVEGVAGGDYDVSIADNSGESSYAQYDTHTFVNDKAPTTLNASLQTLYDVTGVVTGANGTPAADVDVQAVPWVDGAADTDAIDPDDTGDNLSQTDDAGNYDLELQPGTYVIEYLPEGDAGAQIYLGGGQTSADAEKLVVTDGDLTDVDQVLPGYSGGISMDLEGMNDEQLGGTITYQLEGGGETDLGDAFEDDIPLISGTIEQDNLPSGTYDVTINAFSNSGTYAPYTITDVHVGGEAGGPVGADVTDLGNEDLSGNYSPVNFESLPQIVTGEEPTILGASAPQVGDTIALSDVTGIWNEPTGYYYFHWLRNGKQISGATDDSYTLQAGDAGKTISVEVGAGPMGTDFRNFSYTTTSTPVVADADAASSVTPPSITGPTIVGKTLTADPGTWSVPGVTFSYQWSLIDNGTPTVVGTSSTLKLVSADVSTSTDTKTIALSVIAQRPGYTDSDPATCSDVTVQPSGVLKQTKASKVAYDLVTNTYTVTPGTWSPTKGTISYTWVEYATGSTSSTIVQTGGTTFTPTDTGTRLSVLVTDAKSGYASTTVEVAVRTGEAAYFDTIPTVSYTGDNVGDVAQVNSNGAYTPANATPTYQWLRGTTIIKGATKATYTFAKADIGSLISVAIIATAPGHASSNSVTLSVDTVTNATAFAGTNVIVTGDTAIGRTLTASIPHWAPAPTSVTYQWQRDGVSIPGAKKGSYTIVAADIGHYLSVNVTGKRTGYSTFTASTVEPDQVLGTAIANLTAPSIPYSVTEGSLITANVGSYDGTPSSFTYQWFRNDVAIEDATGPTYRTVPSDVDEQLSVAITPVVAGAAPSVATVSNEATIVVGPAAVATTAPSITVHGKKETTASLDSVLSGSAGTWSASALSFDVQWQVNRIGTDTAGWVDLPSAVAPEFTDSILLDSTDPDDFAVGYEYRLEVTASSSSTAPGAAAYSATITIK